MSTNVYYGEYSLRHWLELILSGNVKLPEYQRSFVWTRNDVDLFINSLKNKEFIPPVTIGCFTNNGKGTINYIIDGQQRLTSIFLYYIGYFPKVEKFAEDNKKLYSDQDNGDEESDSSNLLKWTFQSLVGDGVNTKEACLKKIQEEDKDFYSEIKESINDIIDDTFLGFSYIVPAKNEDQSKFYSTVFRHMNLTGIKLLSRETRKALYFLDKDKERFFDSKVFDECSVNKAEVDFVRYAAFASQYEKSKKFDKIMKNYSKRDEKYYEDFIYTVVNYKSQESKKDVFSEFESSFSKDFTKRFCKLKEYLKELKLECDYKSIVDADIKLYGLFYYILVCDKNIKKSEDSINSLHKELDSEIEKIRNDYDVYKNPSLLKNLRPRLETSYNIYSKYLES